MRNKRWIVVAFVILVSIEVLIGCTHASKNQSQGELKLNECAVIYNQYAGEGLASATEEDLINIVNQTDSILSIFEENWRNTELKKTVKTIKRKYDLQEKYAVKYCECYIYGLRLVSLVKLERKNEFVNEFESFYDFDQSIHSYNFEYDTIINEKTNLTKEDISLILEGYDRILENTDDYNKELVVASSAMEVCKTLEVDYDKYLTIIKSSQ